MKIKIKQLHLNLQIPKFAHLSNTEMGAYSMGDVVLESSKRHNSVNGLAVELPEWTKRYLPQEILGTATAIVGAFIAQLFTSNPIVISYAGTAGENVGFYGLAVIREIHLLRRSENSSIWKIAWRTFRNLVMEFGPAEFIDSSLVRPGFMLAAQSGTGSVLGGIMIGKLAADIVFYAIAVNGYELRKKLFGQITTKSLAEEKNN
ncbi:MAG: hypothetical protein WCW66_05860 [Patescibacteria group bacterium]